MDPLAESVDVISSASVRIERKEEVRTVGDLKHYVDAAGHVFSMAEERAKLAGYKLAPGERAPKVETEEATPAKPAAKAKA